MEAIGLSDEERDKYSLDYWADFICAGCGVGTQSPEYGGVGEYYMVHAHIWREAVGGGSEEVMLCIECLELAIGRTLTAADFSDCIVNHDTRAYGDCETSPLLMSRITDGAIVPCDAWCCA